MKTFYLLLVLLPINLFATEVDNFTQRYESIENSLPQINAEINKRVQDSINSENLRSNYCDRESLLSRIKNKFVFFGYSKFEIWMQTNSRLPQKRTLKNHIYKNADIISTGSTVNLPFTMSSLFNVGGLLIGADKFSHFFTEGWIYYHKYSSQNYTEQEILVDGYKKEAGLWGGYTMGIISYADLSANYLGFQFWLSLLGKSELLNKGPFIQCSRNKWKIIVPIDISSFLNNSLDEGINCNTFTKLKLEEIFNENIQKLEATKNRNFTCPISKNKCTRISKFYKERSPWLINEKCL